MEKIVEQTLLYDFYGELLTEHQRLIYEDVVLNDCSYTEVAQEHQISRQGVHDLIKRCNQTLEGYEAKLHLLEKFLSIREKVEQIHVLAQGHPEIQQISNEILEEL
ncbi:MAG: DNA-binding protein [Eubacteriales bacterium]|nr:DNA-binding protein [Eubacteriales bacterium]